MDGRGIPFGQSALSAVPWNLIESVNHDRANTVAIRDDDGSPWIRFSASPISLYLIGAFLIASPGPKVEAWFDRISLDVDPLDEAPEREHTHRCRAQMESLAGISRNIKESS